MNPPGSNVPQNYYPPYYQSFPQSYHPQPNPYTNPLNPPQQYFPPPSSIQHPFSEAISGSKKSADPLKGEKKKKSKTSSKLSSMFRNEWLISLIKITIIKFININKWIFIENSSHKSSIYITFSKIVQNFLFFIFRLILKTDHLCFLFILFFHDFVCVCFLKVSMKFCEGRIS